MWGGGRLLLFRCGVVPDMCGDFDVSRRLNLGAPKSSTVPPLPMQDRSPRTITMTRLAPSREAVGGVVKPLAIPIFLGA